MLGVGLRTVLVGTVLFGIVLGQEDVEDANCGCPELQRRCWQSGSVFGFIDPASNCEYFLAQGVRLYRDLEDGCCVRALFIENGVFTCSPCEDADFEETVNQIGQDGEMNGPSFCGYENSIGSQIAENDDRLCIRATGGAMWDFIYMAHGGGNRCSDNGDGSCEIADGLDDDDSCNLSTYMYRRYIPSPSPTLLPSPSPPPSPSPSPAPVPLLAPDQLGDDVSGTFYSVALSGDGSIMAAGDRLNEVVQVVEQSSSRGSLVAWIQKGATINGPGDGQFGTCVALSEDGLTLAVGAPYYGNPDLTGRFHGLVRTYKFESDVWNMTGEFIGVENEGQLGSSVALSSNGLRLAFGARIAGDTFVYDYSTTEEWNQVGSVLSGSPPYGSRVSLSGDGTRLSVGNPENWGSQFGYVEVYEYDINNDDDWGLVGARIVLPSPAALDLLSGNDLSYDGSRVVVGAMQHVNNGGPGLMMVFEYDGSNWNQLGSTITGNSAGDRFGREVRISDDGETIATGAPGYNGGAGLLQIYSFNGVDWELAFLDIYGNVLSVGETTNFGSEIDLSADASVIATINSGPVEAFGLV